MADFASDRREQAVRPQRRCYAEVVPIDLCFRFFMPGEHLHFVTGRLAEFALRSVVATLALQREFSYTIDVLPITVAALMSPAWIAKHIQVPAVATRVILPGYCQGEWTPPTSTLAVPVEVGPRDLQQLPEFLGGQSGRPAEYGRYD